jgi:hypothetical protein
MDGRGFDGFDQIARLLAAGTSRRHVATLCAQSIIGAMLGRRWPWRTSAMAGASIETGSTPTTRTGRRDKDSGVVRAKAVAPAGADPVDNPSAVTIDTLVFKGTHNSYDCSHQYPLESQIDDFGVWAVELDWAVANAPAFWPTSCPAVRSGLLPVVGHDGPGDGACWHCSFGEFLEAMHDRSRALRYRPLFLYGDHQDWDVTTPAVALSMWWSELERVFGATNVVRLDDYLATHGGRYPTVPELAGKVVLPPTPERSGDRAAAFAETFQRGCVDRMRVERAITTGTGLERPCSCPIDASLCCRVIRIDDFQWDWTFEYGVPPNPIVVDAAANPAIESRLCPTITGTVVGLLKEQVGGEHGTFRFPFKTLGAAVSRAKGITPMTGSVADPKRAGRGWTVILRPGNYPEALTITFPLVLVRDPDAPGVAVVGN